MFKNERNKRIFHIFSNIFFAFIWSWMLYVQYQTVYYTPFEASFQQVYMVVLWSFIVIALGRAVFHYVKLRTYNDAKKHMNRHSKFG